MVCPKPTPRGSGEHPLECRFPNPPFASRSLTQADWRGTTIVRDGVKEVGELKRRYAREVQVHGSGDLIRTLLARELVDELNLLLFPVALGAG